MRVQPDEGVTLRFGSKVPGSAMEVRDVSMDFLYGEAFTESSPEAYERLILDVLLGDATLFPRNLEVDASWKVIDRLEEFWARRTRRRSTAPASGGRAAPTRCWPRRPGLEATVTSSGRSGLMATTLWDTTGSDIIQALLAERRTAGALASGLALTLVGRCR